MKKVLSKCLIAFLMISGVAPGQAPPGYPGGGGAGTGSNTPGTLTLSTVTECFANGSAENRRDPTDAAIMIGSLENTPPHEPITPWNFMLGPNTWGNPRRHESRSKHTGVSADSEAIGTSKLAVVVMGEFRANNGNGVGMNPQTVTASTSMVLAQSGGGIIRKYYYICGRFAFNVSGLTSVPGLWPGRPELGNANAPFLTQLKCGDFGFEWENLSAGGDARTLKIKWDYNNITWYQESDPLKITNPDCIVIVDHYTSTNPIGISGYERSTNPYYAPYGGREVCGVVWAEWLPLGTALPETGFTVVPAPSVPPGAPLPVQVAIKHYPNILGYASAPDDAKKARERNVGIYYMPPNGPPPPYPSYISGLITRHRGTLYTP